MLFDKWCKSRKVLVSVIISPAAALTCEVITDVREDKENEAQEFCDIN